MLLLIVELERSQDKSFALFDGIKWMKCVKYLGRGNGKTLSYLTSCIRDIGELWFNAKI